MAEVEVYDWVAELAEEIGLDEPAKLDDPTKRGLSFLCDDEFELLSQDERKGFREKLGGDAKKLLIDCGGCGMLSLPRYRPEDGFCRVCGAAITGGPISASRAAANQKSTAAVKSLFTVSQTATVADSPAPSPTSGPALEAVEATADPAKFLKLDADNEDWDVREEKLLAEESKRKTAEEAARKKAEAEAEEARNKAEVARLKAEAEAEEARKKAEVEAEKLRREEEERRRLEEEEQRLAIGILKGEKAGQVVRIPDLEPGKAFAGLAPIFYLEEKTAKVWIPPGSELQVNEEMKSGTVTLEGGMIVRSLLEADDICVIEENGELHAVNADPMHLVRADGQPGGPYPYWNEPVKLGAGAVEFLVADNEVEDLHAKMSTVFGRVILEDASQEAGVWHAGKKLKHLILRPDTEFSLGEHGPRLKAVAGQAEFKGAKAGPQKPVRSGRTIMHVDVGGEKKKVFIFARREVRFGKQGMKNEKVENELVLKPFDESQTIGDKQGALALSRESVTLRRDDRNVPLAIDERVMKPGESAALPRRFEMDIGEGSLTLKCQVYRSPSNVSRPESHGQLGVEGGHPFECVRLEREDGVPHTYVFLVRQIRLGSGSGDAIEIPGASPGHCLLMLQKGLFSLVAPKEKVTLVEGETEKDLTPGEPTPLKVGMTIKIGDASILFEETREEHFEVHAAEEQAAE
jgi:hypothetical protein